MTIDIYTIETPGGVRYIGIATPPKNEPHPAIVEVGTGWCLSPLEAETQARRLYALACMAYENVMQARKEARAA